MSDKPQITSLDEAKAALDDEITSTQEMVAIYERQVGEAKLKLAPYEQTLWRLKSIRRRMEPAQEPTVVAVADQAEAA
jgi:hypothetical protein